MRISATAGTFYQSPRYLERAADPANFGLENERVHHVSVGIERQFGPQWNLLVEGYYQQLDNLVTEGDAVTGIATNNGEGISYGVDFVANRQFANGWSANAVYSYNDATQNDNDVAANIPPITTTSTCSVWVRDGNHRSLAARISLEVRNGQAA